MPSQATNYFYTLVAMGVVSLMLTNAFEGQVGALESTAEKKELRRLMEAVAAEGTELVSITEATGATVKVSIETPLTALGRGWRGASETHGPGRSSAKPTCPGTCRPQVPTEGDTGPSRSTARIWAQDPCSSWEDGRMDERCNY
jgi:hypothetical protein